VKAPQRRPPQRRHAWDPALLSEGEIAGIKAMAANQSVGFRALLEKICLVDQVSFAAGGEDGRRETDYAEGKRAVGINLRAIVGMALKPRSRGPEPGFVEPPAEPGAAPGPSPDPGKSQ
jgi:hypothetical protein